MENQTINQNQQPANPVEKNIFEMYQVLGELYSLNYSCLKISNQDMPIDGPSQTYSANDIFRNKSQLKESWLGLKLADVAETRNQTFKDILSAWGQTYSECIQDFDIHAALKEQKAKVTELHNKFFGKNKTFNEIFDGFVAKNQTFKKIAALFDTNAVFMTDNETLNLLMYEYYKYIESLTAYMAAESFDKISKMLDRDVTSEGRPSFYFRKSFEPQITTMSGKEIEAYSLAADKVVKSVNQEIKAENKKLAPLYKKVKKNMSDYEAHNEISLIKSNIFNLLEKQRKAEKFAYFANALLERFAYANTGYDESKTFSFVEALFDLSAGINIFKHKKLEFDSVYVHELEKNYLIYFSQMFGLDLEKTTSKETANQKQ